MPCGVYDIRPACLIMGGGLDVTFGVVDAKPRQVRSSPLRSCLSCHLGCMTDHTKFEINDDSKIMWNLGG